MNESHNFIASLVYSSLIEMYPIDTQEQANAMGHAAATYLDAVVAAIAAGYSDDGGRLFLDTLAKRLELSYEHYLSIMDDKANPGVGSDQVGLSAD